MNRYFHQDYLTVPDGAPLYYKVQGEGSPALVLCDGLGCDGFAWKYLLPQLSEKHRVLRWHYRGHGRSGLPHDRDRIGMLYTCDDLARMMDAAGLDKAVLFGHSMGVQVALEFHRRYASRVQGLVLINGSYGNPLDTFHDSDLLKRALPFLKKWVERFPLQTARLTRFALSTELAVQFAMSVELNRALLDPRDLSPYFEHLAHMDPVVFVRTLDSLATHSAADHLAHVDVPTLVIGGDQDTFTPGRLAREMAERIPGAEFLMVAGGSHTAPLEQPEVFALRIDRFLRTRIYPKTVESGPLPDLPALAPAAKPHGTLESFGAAARAVRDVVERAVTEVTEPHAGPGKDAPAATGAPGGKGSAVRSARPARAKKSSRKSEAHPPALASAPSEATAPAASVAPKSAKRKTSAARDEAAPSKPRSTRSRPPRNA